MTQRFNPPDLRDVVLEAGVVRMRSTIAAPHSVPYRPRICLFVEAESGMILHFEMGEPADDYSELLLQTLAGVEKRLRGLPREIRMRDPRLAAGLRGAVETLGINVVVRESLPMLDQAIQSLMGQKRLSGKPEPGLLDVPGMTLDHLMAFADAAKQFYDARPWRWLIDDDLIQIESPEGPKGTEFCQVLGAGGRTFGLGFVATLKQHEDMRAGAGLPRGRVWTLLFGDIDHIPYDDGEAWERHGLAVAGPQAYPTFMHVSRSTDPEHPTSDQLAWAEGLLRALAESSEDELDSGRWAKQVSTVAGPQTYRLSLPLLLEQMEGKARRDPARTIQSGRMGMESVLRAIGQQMAEHGEMDAEALKAFTGGLRGTVPKFEPKTPAEKAQSLCYEAQDARGRRQVQLAREALAIDPDCCDAWGLLADRAGDPESALPLIRKAVEAGQRQLGPEFFEQNVGHFWGIIETRPYMRAREQLATTLMDLDQFDEAATHLKEMLRLNPGDNQGNRYPLSQALLMANRLDELDALLNGPEYREDSSAEWVFTRLLLAYRRQAAEADLNRRLGEAMESNQYVAPLLTGRKEMPGYIPDGYTPGGEEEAIICVEQIAPGWCETPGAIEWLEKHFSKADRLAKKWNKERERKRRHR